MDIYRTIPKEVRAERWDGTKEGAASIVKVLRDWGYYVTYLPPNGIDYTSTHQIVFMQGAERVWMKKGDWLVYTPGVGFSTAGSGFLNAFEKVHTAVTE